MNYNIIKQKKTPQKRKEKKRNQRLTIRGWEQLEQKNLVLVLWEIGIQKTRKLQSRSIAITEPPQQGDRAPAPSLFITFSLISYTWNIRKKLCEKDVEIEDINRKNRELVDRIKQAAVEAQNWHYRAKYNESVVNLLKNNLQHAISQGGDHVKEGFGDSEVDDEAASYYIDPNNMVIPTGSGRANSLNKGANDLPSMQEEGSFRPVDSL